MSTIAPGHRITAKRISARFSTRFEQEWVKWKLIADPLFPFLLPRLVDGGHPVLDVGCGRGLLGMYLRELGHVTPYHGLDFDETKISPAQKVAEGYSPPLDYHLQDARSAWPDTLGHVCLLDVLHYVPASEQGALLEQCATHVAPGAMFLLRTGIRDAGWRYCFTSGTDKVMAACRLMKTPPLSYPTLEEISLVMAGARMTLQESQPPGRGSLFNNYLLVYRRSG